MEGRDVIGLGLGLGLGRGWGAGRGEGRCGRAPRRENLGAGPRPAYLDSDWGRREGVAQPEGLSTKRLLGRCMDTPRADRKVTVGRATRGHPELQGLVLFESLFATDWYEGVAQEAGGDASELLAAIGRDAADHAEEVRRVLVLWHKAGGDDGARRIRRRVSEELVAVIREERKRAADLLLEASERAPTAEIAERFRQLAREARSHAERLEELG